MNAPETLFLPAEQPLALKPGARPSRRRARFFKWLRRMHAWIGLWGAALGLLFGVSGFLLNHRAVMKIPAGHNAETEVQLALEAAPASPDALSRQLAVRFGYRPEQARGRSEAAREVVWNGQTVRQPERWSVALDAPDRYVRGEYYVGNRFVSVKHYQANVFSLLNRLHMSSSSNAAWVLLADTLAGGLIFLVLSGTLLWTRLHGLKLAAAALVFGGLSAAVCCATAAM